MELMFHKSGKNIYRNWGRLFCKLQFLGEVPLSYNSSWCCSMGLNCWEVILIFSAAFLWKSVQERPWKSFVLFCLLPQLLRTAQYPVLRAFDLIRSTKYDYIFKNSKAKQHIYQVEPAERETDLPEYTQGRFEGCSVDLAVCAILSCYT